MLSCLPRAAALTFLNLAAPFFTRFFIPLRAFEIFLNPRVAAHSSESAKRALDGFSFFYDYSRQFSHPLSLRLDGADET